MIYALFDRDPLYPIMADQNHWYYAHRDELQWLQNPVNASLGLLGADGNFATQAASAAAPSAINIGTTPTALQEEGTQGAGPVSYGGGTVTASAVNASAITDKRMPVYGDQVMPFDITLVAQNEMGQAAYSSVQGVEIINEGSGVSVDDITSEVQTTFIAMHRETWRPINPTGSTVKDASSPAATAFVLGADGSVGAYATNAAGAWQNAAQIWVPSWRRNPAGGI